MISTKIKESIQSYNDELIELRRTLHRKPELSFEEYETTAFVCRYLDDLGIPYIKTEPTGVIATIKGAKSGKTVALRADMDALPVQQLNDVPYQSEVQGKMHACGHDGHTSMLLIAAKALMGVQEELEGNVRLIFQPAEEIGAGAKKIIPQGAMEDVDQVFGIHIWTPMPTNTVSCPAGPTFAAADLFRLHFVGKGGHGAMPEECIDAAVIASSFVMNVQSVVSRAVDPQEPAVLTVGKMEVGTKANIIAENAIIEGTVRTFNHATGDLIEAELRRYAEKTAELYGGTVSIEYIRGTQAVINEEDAAKLVRQVAAEAFGEGVLYEEKATMGAEDFSIYLDHAPGAFALVGCGNETKDTTWAHHHGKFNIDEDALQTGAELYAQFAWAYLKK